MRKSRDLKIAFAVLGGIVLLAAVDFGVRFLLGQIVRIPVIETKQVDAERHTTETVNTIRDSLTRVDAKLDAALVALAARGVGIAQAGAPPSPTALEGGVSTPNDPVGDVFLSCWSVGSR